ncbi:MAG: hypothetical protein PHE51_08015, partial [Eubacteriales bacterium]|nr:hypothetical protein [Eubacteriales bacterium]
MKNNIKKVFIEILVMLADIALICMSYRLASGINSRFGHDVSFNISTLITIEVLTVFLFYLFDLYAPKESTREETLISVVFSSLISWVGTLLVARVAFKMIFTLKFIFLMFVIMNLTLIIWRLFLSFVIIRFKEKKKILILETIKVPSRLARKIKYSCNNINEANYYLIDDDSESEREYVLTEIVPMYDIVFVSANLSKEFQDDVFERSILLKKTVNFLATPTNVSLMGGAIHQFSDTPVLEITEMHLQKYQRFIKRMFDIVLSISAIILLSPAFLVIPMESLAAFTRKVNEQFEMLSMK